VATTITTAKNILRKVCFPFMFFSLKYYGPYVPHKMSIHKIYDLDQSKIIEGYQKKNNVTVMGTGIEKIV
jgi:hypothetical protein